MPEEHPMTDIAAPAAELEAVLAGPLALLRGEPETSLEDLAAAVVTAAPAVVHAEAKPFPELPRHVELTTEVQRALGQVAKIFNGVEIKDRRSLTEDELILLTIEQSVIALVGATMAARLDVIKETVRVHMDVAAEEAGIAVPKAQISPAGEVIVAATPRDQKGTTCWPGRSSRTRCRSARWPGPRSSARQLPGRLRASWTRRSRPARSSAPTTWPSPARSVPSTRAGCAS
jgi:hypothetical protein